MAVAGAVIDAVPTIVTDPLFIIKLFPDAVTFASADTVTFPVPKISGVFGAVRFAVPTIVTVPIPSVSGFGLGTCVTAFAATETGPMETVKLFPWDISVTLPSVDNDEKGVSANEAVPKSIDLSPLLFYFCKC